MATLYEYLASLEAEIRRLGGKVDGMRGPGVVNTPTALTINPPQDRARPLSADAPQLPTPQEQYTYYRGIGNNRAGFAPEVVHPPLS